jgi:hypothetical protein
MKTTEPPPSFATDILVPSLQSLQDSFATLRSLSVLTLRNQNIGNC